MRCRIPVLGTEKEREKKGKLWLFFPLQQLKKILFSVTCPKAIYMEFQTEKKLGLTG